MLMLYVLCCEPDFWRLKTPEAVAPFGAERDRAAGKAWSIGVSEPTGGGGGGGVVDGGGGVADGGGGVADGGGGGGGVTPPIGGGVVPLAVTERETGMRKV